MGRPETKSRSLAMDSCVAVLSWERCGRRGRGRMEEQGVPWIRLEGSAGSLNVRSLSLSSKGRGTQGRV